mgnify:CR=1 FL=1
MRAAEAAEADYDEEEDDDAREKRRRRMMRRPLKILPRRGHLMTSTFPKWFMI